MNRIVSRLQKLAKGPGGRECPECGKTYPFFMKKCPKCDAPAPPKKDKKDDKKETKKDEKFDFSTLKKK